MHSYSWLSSIVYMYDGFFILLSVDGHLGYFHVLAFVNSTAMNIGVHMPLSILVSAGSMYSSGIVGSYGSSIHWFLNWYIVTVPVFFPNSVKEKGSTNINTKLKTQYLYLCSPFLSIHSYLILLLLFLLALFYPFPPIFIVSIFLMFFFLLKTY